MQLTAMFVSHAHHRTVLEYDRERPCRDRSLTPYATLPRRPIVSSSDLVACLEA